MGIVWGEGGWTQLIWSFLPSDSAKEGYNFDKKNVVVMSYMIVIVIVIFISFSNISFIHDKYVF